MVGTRYLKDLLQLFGQIDPGARWLQRGRERGNKGYKIPPYAETQAYFSLVRAHYAKNSSAIARA